MIRFLAALIAVTFAAPAFAEPAPAEVTAELRRITQELLDAVAPGRADVWDRHLDPGIVHVAEDGTVRTKAELLAEFGPLPPGLVGRIAIDRFRAEMHGDTVVVAHEDQEQLDYHGQRIEARFRSLDVWRRTPRGWQMIGQHLAAVLRDPPAMTLSDAELCGYAGSYALTDAIVATISCDRGELVVERQGQPPVRYRAELRDVFFVPGRPRSRRIFLRDAQGRITGFADRREGHQIVWRRVH